MKIPIQLSAIVVVAMLLSACGITSGQEKSLVERARNLGPVPVKRAKLIETFDLAAVKSLHDPIPAWHWANESSESWQLSQEVSVTGYSWRRMPASSRTGRDIDDILNNPDRNPRESSSPEVFDRVILHHRKRVIFDTRQ